MQILKSDELKLKILAYLLDRKWHSFYDIQRGCSVNYSMLKKHIRFMELLGLVEMMEIPPEESATGKGVYKVKITEKGREIVQKSRNW